jgi:hypothetical protein
MAAVPAKRIVTIQTQTRHFDFMVHTLSFESRNVRRLIAWPLGGGAGDPVGSSIPEKQQVPCHLSPEGLFFLLLFCFFRTCERGARDDLNLLAID